MRRAGGTAAPRSRAVLLAAGLLAAGLLAVGCGAAGAQTPAPPLITDRPDFTESAAVVPRAHLQAEGGYTYQRAGHTREHSVGELLLRLPVSGRAELRLELGSWTWRRTADAEVSGPADAAVGGKLILLEERPGRPWRPATALLAATGVPTGAAEVDGGVWTPEARLALGWTLPAPFSLASNLGWARPVHAGRAFHQGLGSVAAGVDLAAGLGLFAEAFGYTAEEPGGPATLWLNGGATWQPRPWLQLDARAGLRAAGPERFLGAGLALLR